MDTAGFLKIEVRTSQEVMSLLEDDSVGRTEDAGRVRGVLGGQGVEGPVVDLS